METDIRRSAEADLTTKDEASLQFPDPDEVIVKGHVTHLRLLLTAWISHFRSGYIEDRTMEMLDRTVCRKVVSLTVRDFKVRDAIGTNPKVWLDMVDLLRIANPSLEERSYGPLEQAGSTFDGPNSSTIVANSVSLLRDLQRLDNLLAIARNVLSAGEKVQNLAAQVGFDREVCSIINLCIKITARGYDGDGSSTVEEDRWQGVINGFKKLLITSLQFLSNLVTRNERLKLLLWVELFDSSVDADGNMKPNTAFDVSDVPSNGGTAEDWLVDATIKRFSEPMGSKDLSNDSDSDMIKSIITEPPLAQQREASPFILFVGSMKDTVEKELLAQDSQADGSSLEPHKVMQELVKRWREMSAEERAEWARGHQERMAEYEAHMDAWRASKGLQEDAIKEMIRNIVNVPDGMDKLQDQLALLTASQKRELADRLLKKSQEVKPLEVTARHDSMTTQATVAAQGHSVTEDLPASEQSPSPRKAKAQPDLFAPPSAEMDFTMIESAQDGVRKLQDGKLQLLKRLESLPAERQRVPSITEHDPSVLDAREQQIVEEIALAYQERLDNAKTMEERQAIMDERLAATMDRTKFDAHTGRTDPDYLEQNLDDEEEDDLEDESGDDESDDSGYAIPGEDGRGLLTDVPLILGPNEIEVLPMIIMSGIVVDPREPEPQHNTRKSTADEEGKPTMNMYTIRCHLLLAQENGRNLLRELLIFVAAWDLREEELYFKFMVKIMEAILMNGLMPFAYGAFKESKDIISPAQAVIMKLLTKIFHSRQGYISQSGRSKLGSNTEENKEGDNEKSESTPPALRYDIQIVHCLFSEFRQSIIPQICSLVFLQGQIRRGRAAIEDFPLNLWDMERMYEGVYQYLEFFAILTDHESWKTFMADWEVASELITLLRELELAIPKIRLPIPNQQQHQAHRASLDSAVAKSTADADSWETNEATTNGGVIGSEKSSAQPKAPVSVETPYDPNGPSAPIPVATHPILPPPPSVPPPPMNSNTTSTSSTPTPPFTPQQAASEHLSSTPRPPYLSPPLHDEPADFEWRNLKKLCVLVLSSLVWKSPRLQEQVRQFGGVPAILSCCTFDDHNPFIREHAIMCLRFLVEGNVENEALVRRIARRESSKLRREHEDLQSRSQPSPHSSIGDAVDSDADIEADHAGEDEDEEQDSDDMAPVDPDFPSLPVPMEVLDPHGYETYMDVHGQVGLRRKDTTGSPHGSGEQFKPVSGSSEYPDVDFIGLGAGIGKGSGDLTSLGEAQAGDIADGPAMAKGGKRTGLLESIGGLPEWIQNIPPRQGKPRRRQWRQIGTPAPPSTGGAVERICPQCGELHIRKAQIIQSPKEQAPVLYTSRLPGHALVRLVVARSNDSTASTTSFSFTSLALLRAMFTAFSAPSASTPSSPPFQSYILPTNPFRRTSRASVSRSSTSSIFSRRKSSTTSTGTHDSASTALTTPSTSPAADESASYLSSAAGTISCSCCHADLALTSQIISKGFTGRHGRAYLLSSVQQSPNIIPTPNSKPYRYSPSTGGPHAPGSEREAGLPNTTLHRPVPRHLVTGMHTVSDLSCAVCGNVLGWKYVAAEEEAQRYKVGKFILESRRTHVGACWDGAGGHSQFPEDEVEEDGSDEDFDYGVEGWSSSRKEGKLQDGEDIVFDSQDEDECEDLFAGVWSCALARKRRARRDL
ncbi:hypothetical protein FH972_023395 [Carpinus fangiana]|uniref:Copper transport protein 86 n=1 Tax=Carpinus fangiana TaxID=176857 RepID=A0A5N6KVE4_9ROSI|nr:hypothetical protein FH972_023395 [Carpinus fangiana]